MMKKANELLCISLLVLVIWPASVFAQQLVLGGKIAFERKENLHKQFTEMNSWTEEMMKRMPKYRTDQFELSFNTHRSLYKLVTEDESTMAQWLRVAGSNTVMQSYDDGRYA